jgi:mRNA interferase MazF
MKRGEIWWINFHPSIGSEVRKTRPAVIVSNDLSNQFSKRVQVVPATSNTNQLYPPECFVQIKGKTSKIMADQIMTVSKERLYGRLGSNG